MFFVPHSYKLHILIQGGSNMDVGSTVGVQSDMDTRDNLDTQSDVDGKSNMDVRSISSSSEVSRIRDIQPQHTRLSKGEILIGS